MTTYDPTLARTRLERMWSLNAEFGSELAAREVYLGEWVSDRYALVNGVQLLRDELQFADPASGDLSACSADLSLPSVATTLAHTTCGDRIHQGDDMLHYQQTVASRFATLSEIGELKVEAFSPTGGGTDDGAILAHVTIAHQLDPHLRRSLYEGNPGSYVLACFDLKTHVGRLDDVHHLTYGKGQESPWREPRNACGAIVGALASARANPTRAAHDNESAVFARLLDHLGPDNVAHLTRGIVADDGVTDVTYVVAAAIVAIEGMKRTAEALLTREKDFDERSLAHLTASITVNCVSTSDLLIYLARATVFQGQLRWQGFGTDASLYQAQIVDGRRGRQLQLSYRGLTTGFPILDQSHPVRPWAP